MYGSLGGAFFYGELFKEIKSRYASIFKSGGFKLTRAAATSGISNFGWYGKILNLADTPKEIKEIEQMPLYDFMNYLSYKITEIDFQNKINEL